MHRGLFGRLGKLGLNHTIQLNISPQPIYLTQWKIVGNSEVHGNEIWSCGEYNATDGKYHILVKPQEGSIADIALTEPLRKVNSVADTLEVQPSITQNITIANTDRSIIPYSNYGRWYTGNAGVNACIINVSAFKGERITIKFVNSALTTYTNDYYAWMFTKDVDAPRFVQNRSLVYTEQEILLDGNGGSVNSDVIVPEEANYLFLFVTVGSRYGENVTQYVDVEVITSKALLTTKIVESEGSLSPLVTPTTELIEVPQIQEAESYTCVISQGGKAVSWSSFETE